MANMTAEEAVEEDSLEGDADVEAAASKAGSMKSANLKKAWEWEAATPPLGKPPVLDLGGVEGASIDTDGMVGTRPVQADGTVVLSSPENKFVSINEDIEVEAETVRDAQKNEASQSMQSLEKEKEKEAPAEAPRGPGHRTGSHILRLDTLESDDIQRKVEVSAEANTTSNALGELVAISTAAEEKKSTRLQEKKRQREKGLRSVMSSKVDIRHHRCRKRVDQVLNMMWFDFAIGVVIFANAIVIGIESEIRSQGSDPQDSPWLVAADFVFLGIYTFELFLRLYAYGRLALANPWVRFDAFLVVIGYGEIILTLAYRRSAILDKVMLVRILRLTRVARMVRFFTQFRVLWALVQGLIHSLNTLFWTFLLIFGLLYIFAILSMDLMTEIDGHESELSSSENDYNRAVKKFNQGLGHAMLTLAQFLTFDSIGLIYRPIILQEPYLAVFFTMFVLVVSIALMNLVIAVMVESNIEQANEDRDVLRIQNEEKRKSMLPKLKALFRQLDEDGSGELDLMEIMSAPEETKAALQDIAKGLDIEEIFKMLDYDGGGRVDSDEFCEGLLKAAKQDKPLELLRLVHVCQEIMKNSREVVSVLQALNVYIDEGVVQTVQTQSSKPAPSAAPVKAEVGKSVALLTAEVSSVQKRVGGMDARLLKMERSIQRIVKSLEVTV